MEHPELKDIKLLDSGWLNKYILTFTMPDGSEKTYETISRKKPADYERELRRSPDTPPAIDAVSIIPTTDDGKIILIKEFRYPLNSWCFGMPAGLLEKGEAVETCVERELREETGYAVKRRADGSPMLRILPQPSFTSNGMTEECLAIVRAQVEKVGEQETEPSEFIEVYPLDIADIPRFLEENRIPIGARAQFVLESYADRIGPGSEACLQ
jgi:ADP-ribose pyrophosphatase